MPGRRQRCDGCHLLATMLLDWWPNGMPKRPRRKLCPGCYAHAVEATRA